LIPLGDKGKLARETQLPFGSTTSLNGVVSPLAASNRQLRFVIPFRTG
jgi:hypothetical protein